MKRINSISSGFVLLTALLISVAGAQSAPPQDQSDSLADYAKKARKDKPKATPKVYDNDNLPKDDKLSVVGAQPVNPDPSSTAAPADAANAPADAKAPDTKAADDEVKRQAQWKDWQTRLTAQKDQIDLLTRETDVLQREYQVRAAAFYADAGNRLRNSAAWDKQDAQYKEQIAAKQKALDDARQKLEDLQEDARKAGVPAAMRE
jgi:hypothetical protein